MIYGNYNQLPASHEKRDISSLPAVALNTSSQPSLSSFATVRGSPPNAFGLQKCWHIYEKETKSSHSSNKLSNVFTQEIS